MTSTIAPQTIAAALGRRSDGTAPCPVCQPEGRADQNALSIAIKAGLLLLYCHKSGCGFSDILTAAGIAPGTFTPPDPTEATRREKEARAEAERKSRHAMACWHEALPIGGTPADAYLRGRGITAPLPPSLRYHPEAWHGPTACRLPAMIALVEGADLPAVHRTFLKADGAGKSAADPNKMMLGATAGGTVRLSSAGGPLVVAEGIETALSLASGLLDGPLAVWAALSARGMACLRLPPGPGKIIIASDGDKAGRHAMHKLAERACDAGWRVSLADAPDGQDWNDLLRKGGAQ